MGGRWIDIRVRLLSTEVFVDRLADAVDVSEHLVVPEAHDAKSLTGQPCCATRVFGCPLVVLTAIDLHEEPSLKTDEIDDVVADDLLAPELVPTELTQS